MSFNHCTELDKLLNFGLSFLSEKRFISLILFETFKYVCIQTRGKKTELAFDV